MHFCPFSNNRRILERSLGCWIFTFLQNDLNVNIFLFLILASNNLLITYSASQVARNKVWKLHATELDVKSELLYGRPC